MELIQIANIDVLNEDEKELLTTLANEYYQKVIRALKNECSIKINIKEYGRVEDNPDKKVKYSIHVVVTTATKLRFESGADDWDFARTIHKVFKDIERQIEHKVR